MQAPFRNIIFKVVTVIAVTTFFVSCDGRSKEVQQLNVKAEGPLSEGTGVNLKYVDSGKVVAHLKTPYLKDFANETFPFVEFPDGIELTFIDKDNKKNVVTSDYAIQYTDTNLIDLRENVVLVTADSATLKAQQLYWDQNNKWIFTDQPYTLITADGSSNQGDLFDSNEDFSDFVSLNNIAKQYIKEEETQETDTP